MQLCSTTFKDESDPARLEERSMLYAQIYAFIRLYMELDPNALFVRNVQDAGALELAALTNKVEVAQFLVMLHATYGRDVNAPNQKGHTLLHLMARKGDDCSDTLEALLAIKVFSSDGRTSQRLLRMDVLNEGKKTPLDVAVACVDLFSVGKDRTVYNRVISVFHNAIEEEAIQLVGEPSSLLSFLNMLYF
jgi:ankyrin repeat protein